MEKMGRKLCQMPDELKPFVIEKSGEDDGDDYDDYDNDDADDDDEYYGQVI